MKTITCVLLIGLAATALMALDISHSPDPYAYEIAQPPCATNEIDISNTCIIDGDKKYVLEINHEPCAEGARCICSALKLREVAECPCK